MILSNEDYNFVFSKAVRLCIDLAIPYKNGYLLGKRAHEPYKKKYALPGGRVLFGETISQAISRIGKEELGIERFFNPKLLKILEFPEEAELCGRHSISIVYELHVFSDVFGVEELKINPKTFVEIKGSAEVKKLDIVKQHRILVNAKEFKF